MLDFRNERKEGVIGERRLVTSGRLLKDFQFDIPLLERFLSDAPNCFSSLLLHMFS